MKYIPVILILVLSACSSTRYYIVRHAEKVVMTKDSAEMMVKDPPLSEAGKERAVALKNELKNKGIKYIFSTYTLRTLSTVHPLNEVKDNIHIQIYSPSKDSLEAFVNTLKAIRKGNVLVVAHSNTVDDIVNKLCGKTEIPGDLADTEYDNLFIIKKKGGQMIFTRRTYGKPSVAKK